MTAATVSRYSEAAHHTDYAYVNARVRGMRARLLGRESIAELIGQTDLRAVVQKLLATDYRADLERRLLHGHDATQVDQALRDNAVRTFTKARGLLGGEAWQLIAPLLGQWDLFSIKTILRGKHLRLGAEDIADNLVPVGQIGQSEAEELTRQPDVRAVVDTLLTWRIPFAQGLGTAVAEYAEGGSLAALEITLDHRYYEWTARQLVGRGKDVRIARHLLATQIDTLNLLTALRLLKSGVEQPIVEEYFVPGGARIQARLFGGLASSSHLDEFLDLLRGTPYSHVLEAATTIYVRRGGSIPALERALEENVFRSAHEAGRGEPLGIGVAIGYLWDKANEISNLRIIVKGVAVGLPANRVKEELILV